jgi:hypothetical protein
MNKDPTIQFFNNGESTNYADIAAIISCPSGGRKKRRGGVGLKRGLFDPDEVVPPPFGPAAKRPNKVAVYNGPQSPPPLPAVPVPVDPNTEKIKKGLELIDDGIRKKAAGVVEKNLWSLVGIGAATGAFACVAPQLALLPLIAAFLSSYSPSLAASIRTPGGVTLSQLEKLVSSAKTNAIKEVEKQIESAKKDQKNQSAKLTGALDRLSELAAKKDKIVTLFDKLSGIADRASTVKKPDETIALIEETKAAVESAPEPEPAAPVSSASSDAMDTKGGSRRRRASAPKRTRRSSSGRRRRYTRRR